MKIKLETGTIETGKDYIPKGDFLIHTSIAVSLKRIADQLETMNKAPSGQKVTMPEGFAEHLKKRMTGE